jgi:phosphomannomutase / phosphoglucomutase
MRWDVLEKVPYNSYDYFDRTLITSNGFREYDFRWVLGREVNPNGFLVLGKAYGTYLQKRCGERRVVVGHDFRQYSQDLSRSFIIGLLSTGAHVTDIGLVLTPMVYFAQHHFGVKGGAMVTASHNENGWTGLKLAKNLSSTLEPPDIQDFRQLVADGQFVTGPGQYESFDGIFEEYCKDLQPLPKRLKVVVAAGNGTAGRFAPAYLEQLGCEVIPLDCTADWNFSRHNPNPEDVSFLESIREETIKARADVGIGIDGDGDRIGAIDDKGREIFSDKLGLLVARWLCRKETGRPIVIDVKSTGLFYSDPVLRGAGANVITWKTGHSYIKAKVAEADALAGFEKSGHWFFNRPFGKGYDDALASTLYLLRLLSESPQSLSQLVDSLPRSWQSPTLGVECPDNVKYDVSDAMLRQYEEAFAQQKPIAGSRIKDIIKVNGVRFVLEDDSWGLVRASSNKPALVVVAEARSSVDQLYSIVEDIQAKLAATGKVGEYDQQMPQRAQMV